MKIRNNTILVTGGATGIGFAIAESLVNAGNEVIICGRRIEKLKEAKNKIPQLHIKVCDLSKEEERRSLFKFVSSEFKNLNVLINNAGIQRMIDFRQAGDNLFNNGSEIEVNLVAPVHLSSLLIPAFINQKEAAIINISSGLGFVPIAFIPLYCSTKAALHSFSISLRHQLKDTSIKVFEIIPPIVDTELDNGERETRGQMNRGIPPIEVAKETLKALEGNVFEIAVGTAENLRLGSRNNPELMFQRMNQNIP